MEDPSEKWEIQEYSSAEGSNSKVSWIMDEGLKLGKNIVISSAPFVLPPLVLISAHGIAFSIPSGLTFASYVCIEKLMSMLLPRPTCPLMLENGIVSKEEEEEVGFRTEHVMEDEEKEQMEDTKRGVDSRIELVEGGEGIKDEEVLPEEDEYLERGVDNDDQKPKADVEESVKEEGYDEDGGECLEGEDEAPPEGIDVKIDGVGEEEDKENDDQNPKEDVEESVKEEGYEEDVGEYLEGEDAEPQERIDVKIEGVGEEEDKENDEQKPKEDVEESLKEEGDEEDGGEYLEGGDEAPPEGIVVKIQGMGEEEDKEPVIESGKGEQPLDDVRQVEEDEKNGSNDSVAEKLENTHNEDEDVVRETRGLLEILSNEGGVGGAVEKDKRKTKETSVTSKESNEEKITTVEEMEEPMEDKSVKLEKLNGEMEGTGGERGHGGPKEKEEIKERVSEQNLDAVPREVEQGAEMGGTKQRNGEEKSIENVVGEEKLIGELYEPTNGKGLGEVGETTEEQSPVANKKEVIERGGTENEITQREKEIAVHSNADAREIADESGVDDKNELVISTPPQFMRILKNITPEITLQTEVQLFQ